MAARDGLWTMPPCARLAPPHRAWTYGPHCAQPRRRVDPFSVIKRIRF
jgi:hypothetical protein